MIWWKIMHFHDCFSVQFEFMFNSIYSAQISLCSRNFQNVKLRLDFVEIWSFYRHSDFTWNQILVNSNGPKMSFLAILEVLNFDFSQFEQLSSPKFTKIQSSGSLKWPKMTFLTVWIRQNLFHVKLEWR